MVWIVFARVSCERVVGRGQSGRRPAAVVSSRVPAMAGSRASDEFDCIPMTTTATFDQQIPPGVSAWFACELEAWVEADDHDLLVCRVLEASRSLVTGARYCVELRRSLSARRSGQRIVVVLGARLGIMRCEHGTVGVERVARPGAPGADRDPGLTHVRSRLAVGI